MELSQNNKFLSDENCKKTLNLQMQYRKKVLDTKQKLIYIWFSAMFTRVDIMLCAEVTRDDLIYIGHRIEAEVLRIEAFANRFNPKSELSLINNNAFDQEMRASPELFDIICECQEFNRSTNYNFDITVNSLNEFRFGAENIQLNRDKCTISFSHPDVQLDLSGFIKGYAIRPIIEILTIEGIKNALVNFGNSSIYAKGNHPYGEGWKVKHSQYNDDNSCILVNSCLTTSGNNEHTRWKIKHPKTGLVPNDKKNVSIITADPALGEVLSTAIYLSDNKEKKCLLAQFKAKEFE